MKRLTIYCLTCLIGVSPLFAQQGVTQCGTPTGQPKFPIETYQELPDPSSPSDLNSMKLSRFQVQDNIKRFYP